MASCCVSREVWIHSLLAVPVVLHAVRGPGRTGRTGRTGSWKPASMGNTCESVSCVHLCTAAPVQVGKPAKSAVMRQRGDVAGVRATIWDTAMRP